MIKTKNGNVIQFIDEKDISLLKGDVVINWITPSLTDADKSFFDLHRKAGPQLYDASLIFKNKINESDSFSTIAGLLEFNLCIHTVLPKKRTSDYNLMWRNTLQNIKRYKLEGNICRNVYCSLPDVIILDFFKSLNLYDSLFEKLTFVFLTEDKSLEDFLKKEVYDSKWEKFLKLFFDKVN